MLPRRALGFLEVFLEETPEWVLLFALQMNRVTDFMLKHATITLRVILLICASSRSQLGCDTKNPEQKSADPYCMGCPAARMPLPVAQGWPSILKYPAFTIGSS